MIATISVPQAELKRVADANRRILDVAEELADLAKGTSDLTLSEKLQDCFTDLVDAAKTINTALRTAAYLADAI